MNGPSSQRFVDERFEGLTAEDLLAGGAALAGNEFDGCTFVSCDLTEASLRGAQLYDCHFERSELPLVDLTEASLRGVTFDRCRLTGVDIGVLARDPLGVEASFRGCDLSFALFRKLDLTRFSFEECIFNRAEFKSCHMPAVAFDGCDLTSCLFDECDLTRADLRTARNYFISPTRNRIKGLRASVPEALSFLAAIDVVLE